MTSVNRFDRPVLNGAVDVRESFDGKTMSAANAPRYLPELGLFGFETTDRLEDRVLADVGSLPISYTLVVEIRMNQMAIQSRRTHLRPQAGP
ncbi:hypothetical protein [Bradyrhizobium sp. BR 1432]|uniref:hypothetical protein n=1 Tax=Bradyrhizobium sp. BR 1432 TaxID=3447966 RepID=UPI003EE7CAF7